MRQRRGDSVDPINKNTRFENKIPRMDDLRRTSCEAGDALTACHGACRRVSNLQDFSSKISDVIPAFPNPVFRKKRMPLFQLTQR